MPKNLNSGLGIKTVDENAQVYFDLEENIPDDHLKRYKRAIEEAEVDALRRNVDRLAREHLDNLERLTRT